MPAASLSRDNAVPLLQGEALRLEFGGRRVLDDVSLSLRRGEIVTLIGPNGAGKTSLVRLLLGLQRASAGSVRRAPGLRIGYVPQRLHVDPHLPLSVQRFLRLGGAALPAVRAALAEVGIEALLQQPLQAVSGGELQRVLLARALLRRPDLLVLDEPVQGVDVGGQAELYALIGSLRERHGCGILMVSHDLHLVMAQTDRVICLNHHICCHGHPEQVTLDPAYIALFGDRHSRQLAVYHHEHDHQHGIGGEVVGDSCEHHD